MKKNYISPKIATILCQSPVLCSGSDIVGVGEDRYNCDANCYLWHTCLDRKRNKCCLAKRISMKQEDKELLLKDLCARLPYGVCAELPNHHLVAHTYHVESINMRNGWTEGVLECCGRKQIYSAKVEDVKMYLRPMSSMTEEECLELSRIKPTYDEVEAWKYIKTPVPLKIANYKHFDFFNMRHLDWRGLIEKSLALEAPEGMYDI